jgi:2-polyprenyl-3-methyl-5-hydroxy-6-metoxy-1,4-benzoquinol methylase
MEETANRQFVELERTHFWFVGRRRIFFTLLDRELAGRHDLHVLDVGCGAGGMLDPLARYGRVTGVDMQPELVEFCHRRGFPDVVVGSAYELPAPSGTVDLVTLFDTIEHVPDDRRALRETARVLAPGGLVFISTPAYEFLFANNDRIAHHERRYTVRALRRKLLDAGLEPVQLTYFNTWLFPAILPAVLAGKLAERWRDPGDRTNLSAPIPAPVNRTLAAVMGSERRVLLRRSFPFGHSIIAIARRPTGA